MAYNKPEVVRLDSALKVIQGTLKGALLPESVCPQAGYDTIGAYEADE